MKPRLTFHSLFLFLFGVLIIIWVLTLPGCRSNVPAIDAKFWAGDSKNHGITRAQDHETLVCEDPRFDDYVCLSYDDLKKIYETLLQCKQWSEVEMMDSHQAFEYYKKNKPVLRRVIYAKPKSVESFQY